VASVPNKYKRQESSVGKSKGDEEASFARQLSSSKLTSSNLETKARQFLASLYSSDPNSIKANSELLFHILKTIASYHGKKLLDLVQGLDEECPLNIAKLRFRLCNQTVISMLTSQESK